VQLDTATEHYTQTVGAPSGLTNLQLYNNPVGLSGATGWLPRDPSLSVDTTTGMLAPATLPFGLHIAPTAGITTLASLVSEDGISLGVGLARAPAAVTGQVSGSTVTYPGVFTSTAPLTTTVDDGVQGAGTNQFNYIGSTWVHCTAPPSGSNCSPIYYNGTNSASRTLNDYATLTFTGTGIVYYASEDTNRGYAAVSLDGGGETLVDLYSATQRGNVVVYTRTGLSNGTHTLKVRVSGQKDAASSNIVAAIDRVDITTGATVVSSDLSLRATASGVDARVVLHGPSETGPFTLTIAPDPSTNTQLAQDADGTIEAIQPITTYGDDGVNPVVVTQTEYIVQPPSTTDSNADPAALVSSGPVTPTLAPTAGITQYVTLAVDPAWLNNPHRAFPVTLDLPILTADGAVNTGVFGTANSCAPNAKISQAVVVGTENGCTYNGQVSFNLSSLPAGASIASATLNMYTPNQTGSTGVQVLQNAPPPSDNPTVALASWNTAPGVVTSTAPLAQSGSAGRWQSWDVTSLAQQWAQNGSTNGGLTLTGNGAPVRFASPGGLANDSLALAPYLTVTYGSASGGGVSTFASASHVATNATTAASPTQPFHDGQPFIYGESGSYDATGPGQCPSSPPPGSPPGTTLASNTNITCYGNEIKVGAVHNTNTFGGQYIRFGVDLACPNEGGGVNPSAPTAAWWDHADEFGIGTTRQIITAAYANGLVPIVNLGAKLCSSAPYNSQPSPALWAQETTDFASYLSSFVGPSRPIYFEIGNEEDLDNPLIHYKLRYQGVVGGKPFYYPEVFGRAAQGLDTLRTMYHFSNFTVMVGGLFLPTAAQNSALNPKAGCGSVNSNLDSHSDGSATDNRILIARDAVNDAQADGVNYNELGFAVHPYGYDTKPGEGFWRNYYNRFPGTGLKKVKRPDGSVVYVQVSPYRGWGGICQDLGYMLATWTGSQYNPHHIPVFITETNWSTGPDPVTCGNPMGCEGSYLVDLFTYLFDKYSRLNSLGKYSITASTAPVHLLWYRGVDAPGQPLGLYKGDGTDKDIQVFYQLPGGPKPNINTCYNGAVIGYNGLAHDYYWLRNGGCYQRQQGKS